VPDPAERRLLVAIHDVSPAHAARVGAACDLLARYGVDRYALFVVPDWHGGWPLDRHPEFTARLRTLAADGAEIFLHGFRHDEVGLRRSIVQRVRAFGRTAGEAEFLNLDRDAAAGRIDEGLAVLEREGLTAVGFVPPAWFHGAALSDVLISRGLDLTEDAWTVWSVTRGRRWRAPAVRWSTRATYRALAGAAIARMRRPVDRMRRVVRLAIHPPDVDHPVVARSLERALHSLVDRRHPTSYRALLHDQ